MSSRGAIGARSEGGGGGGTLREEPPDMPGVRAGGRSGFVLFSGVPVARVDVGNSAVVMCPNMLDELECISWLR